VTDDEEGLRLPVWAGLCRCTEGRSDAFAMSAAITAMRACITKQKYKRGQQAASPVANPIVGWLGKRRAKNGQADRNVASIPGFAQPTIPQHAGRSDRGACAFQIGKRVGGQQSVWMNDASTASPRRGSAKHSL